MIVAWVMLGHGYEPGMGLGKNNGGRAGLVSVRGNCGKFGLGYCHTLISSGDLCLMTCDHSLVLVRCLAPIIRQFVKFQDMPENQKNIDAQSVSFRDTPEIKRKRRCIIK